jgi:DNA-binding NtrC family response regulator
MTSAAINKQEVTIMLGLLIADKDLESRKQMADIFIEAGYNVMVTSSAANALAGILRKTTQVVLLGSEFDGLPAVDLIPLLKKCNRELTIILVSDEVPLPQMRKARREGIFYHALKPADAADSEEIRQAVQCAFASIINSRDLRNKS